MARRSFAHRNETFGLDGPRPWAGEALRLVFHVPRAYAPLAEAWDRRHPGTAKALERLVSMGFVAYQPPVVIDTRTAELSPRCGRAVARYRTTSRGQRFVAAMAEDIRSLEDAFPHTKPTNVKGVARLLRSFDLEDSHARFGLSVPHGVELSKLPERNGRWWVHRFLEEGLIRELPERYADTREVIPAHWRVTRLLCRQLEDVIDSFESAPASLKVEFRLRRSRFLDDIDPARVGISGATDYDHDIEAQRILGALLGSRRCAAGGIFSVEPRINLPLDTTTRPWSFSPHAGGRLFYQPDAELRESDESGLRRGVIEYERYQTRRDAWNHVERYLGWLHTMTLPFEASVLRFVVDSDARVNSYVKLIEAFCDYALDHQERLPANQVTLAVSSTKRVLGAPDPLDPHTWFRIDLPRRAAGADTGSCPVLHPAESSPYDEYFSRG